MRHSVSDLAEGVPSPQLLAAAWWTTRILSTGKAQRAQLLASYLSVPTGGSVSAEDMVRAERLLVDAGLALETVDALAPTNELLVLSKLEGEAFSQGLMVSLMSAVPPMWLLGAAAGGRVREELIPGKALAVLDECLPDERIRHAALTAAASATRREQQAEIGLRGEGIVLTAVAGLLEQAGYPELACRVAQVSLISASFGYDIWAPMPTERSLHLEVKTCSSRLPYRIYLSRHEAEVAASDCDWRLVVCAVNPSEVLLVAGLCRWAKLSDCVPVDPCASCRWETSEMAIAPESLSPLASLLGGG